MLDGRFRVRSGAALLVCGSLLFPTLVFGADAEGAAPSSSGSQGAERQRTDPIAAADEPAVAPARGFPPWYDVNFGLGLGFGGENLATFELMDGSNQELDAGRGVALTLGAKVTPLWVLDSIGFGVGVDIGWKYGAITAKDASLGLRRFPVVATAHGLIRLSPQWYLRFAGGLTYEMGISLRGSGLLEGVSADAENALGPIGEGGVLYAVNHLGIDVAFRYAALKYDFGSASVDANHGAFVVGFHYIL